MATTEAAPPVLVPRNRLIVGEPHQVANALTAAHARGALLRRTRAVHRPDGLVEVRARILEPAEVVRAYPWMAYPRPQARTLATYIALGVGVPGAITAVVVYGPYLAELAKAGVGLAVVALVAWMLLGRSEGSG